MAKKLGIIVAFLGLFAIQFTKIDVPIEFPNNEIYTYKIQNLVVRAFLWTGDMASTLNYGVTASNVRHLIHGISKITANDDPEITAINTKINGVNVRVYKKLNLLEDKNLPILIFYHGGAFFAGSPDMYHNYLSELTKKTNAVTIFVDYRLAPQYPFPAPTDDCYSVTKYVLESGNEFGDTNRVILAGDSAGGNIVAVMTQRLLAEKAKLPKLQVLIYPWTQMFNNKQPSLYKYESILGFRLSEYIAWYLGYNSVSEELNSLIKSNNHTLLLNHDQLMKYKSYTDSSWIPDEYKIGKKYYQTYETIRETIFPKSLHSTSILKKDKKLENSLKKLLTPAISPGLAEPEKLKGLPKAHFVMCEMDVIKDEGLIYSERLRKSGVSVTVKFYENCFHGSVQMTDSNLGFTIARTMLNDLAEYISKNV